MAGRAVNTSLFFPGAAGESQSTGERSRGRVGTQSTGAAGRSQPTGQLGALIRRRGGSWPPVVCAPAETHPSDLAEVLPVLVTMPVNDSFPDVSRFALGRGPGSISTTLFALRAGTHFCILTL